MYFTHYGFNELPFQINIDPKFLWLGEKHQEVLATLKVGMMQNDGFLLITGNVGTGKTTIIKAFTNEINGNALVAKISDPRLDTLDFFKMIARAYNMKGDVSSKASFLMHFTDFLHEAYANNKTALLIIDEAQRVDDALLEEIRHLANIEKDSKQLFNVFFVGQREFNDTILAKQNHALRQRVTVRQTLESLNRAEVGEYVKHRLKVAGSEEEIFTSGAIREIFRLSGGIPRLINTICNCALMNGYARNQKRITPKIIRECAAELQIPDKKHEEAPVDEGVEKTGFQSIKDNRGHRIALCLLPLAFLLLILTYAYASSETGSYLKKVKHYFAAVVQDDNGFTAATHVDKVQTPIDTTALQQYKTSSVQPDTIAVLPPTPVQDTSQAELEMEGSQGSQIPVTAYETATAEKAESTLSSTRSETMDNTATRVESESPDPGEVVDWFLNKRSRDTEQISLFNHKKHEMNFLKGE